MAIKVEPDIWIEIFGGGKVTDSQGQPHDGDKIIDQVLASFAKDGVDAPLVIGHPDDEAPGYGRVTALKETVRNGRRWLLGKPVDVLASFRNHVNSGWFPHRSISVDNTGKLLHVGFLPQGVNPAVQGMLPAAFQEPVEGTLFFTDFAGAERFFLRRLRDWLISQFGVDDADTVIPQYELDQLHELELREALGGSEFSEKEGKEKDMVVEQKQFSAADIEAAKAEATRIAQEQMQLRFAAAQAEEAKQRAGIDFAAVVTQRIKEGKWAPAIKDAGVLKIPEGFGIDKIEFSQADGSVLKKSLHELLVDVIDAAVKAPKLHRKEFAGAENEYDPSDETPSVENAQREGMRLRSFMSTQHALGVVMGPAEAEAALRQQDKEAKV